MIVASCFNHIAEGQSLIELIQIAKDNNLELKILENEYLTALEKAPQVSQLSDPDLGIGTFPLPVETRLGSQILRLSATQMFPWFGTLDSKKELELIKARSLLERTSARKLNLEYEVKQAYYQLYKIEQSQLILKRNIRILEALKRIALSKVESGNASAADVIRVQLKLEEMMEELDILDTSRRFPTVEINQILNRALDQEVKTLDSLSFAQNPKLNQTLALDSLVNHPMLRMFEIQQEISKHSISLNEMDSKPTFGVGMDYIMVDARNDAIPDGNGKDILQLRASIKIPIYKKKYGAKEREENLKILGLDYQKADAISKFKTIIEKAIASYETAEKKINLYNKQIQLTESAIRILKTSYSTSGHGFDELLRLENELINYDMKILDAIVQSHISKSSIERFITG